MPVRIVVVTHKALPALKRCLASVEKWTKDVPYSLHVIDSGSNDGTSAYLRSLARAGKAAVHSFRGNLGKAAAINFAVDFDKGASPWYVVLDDDAEARPGWLSGLMKAARRHPSASIIGCRSVDQAGRVFSAEMFSWFYGIGYGEKDLGQRGYTRFCDSVAGVCMLIRGDVFRRIRFWDELKQPCEDSDFCLRARKLGLRVLYCGAVEVRHAHLRRHGRFGARNTARMRAKWGLPLFPDSHALDACYTGVWKKTHAGDWKGVLALCRRLTRLDPVPAYAWGLAGLSLLNLGRKAQARKAFEKALAQKHYKKAFTAQILSYLAKPEGPWYNHPWQRYREIFYGFEK
jgi:GT2 family glycosyltransferase